MACCNHVTFFKYLVIQHYTAAHIATHQQFCLSSFRDLTVSIGQTFHPSHAYYYLLLWLWFWHFQSKICGIVTDLSDFPKVQPYPTPTCSSYSRPSWTSLTLICLPYFSLVVHSPLYILVLFVSINDAYFHQYVIILFPSKIIIDKEL